MELYNLLSPKPTTTISKTFINNFATTHKACMEPRKIIQMNCTNISLSQYSTKTKILRNYNTRVPKEQDCRKPTNQQTEVSS